MGQDRLQRVHQAGRACPVLHHRAHRPQEGDPGSVRPANGRGHGEPARTPTAQRHPGGSEHPEGRAVAAAGGGSGLRLPHRPVRLVQSVELSQGTIHQLFSGYE